MSTPKEKAQDLVGNSYLNLTIHVLHKDCEGDYAVASGQMTVYSAKQCALKAVDEILNMYLCTGCQDCCVNTNYWQQVRTEIENLV